MSEMKVGKYGRTERICEPVDDFGRPLDTKPVCTDPEHAALRAALDYAMVVIQDEVSVGNISPKVIAEIERLEKGGGD